MQVVDDVDASHECDASVDVTELAMQAAQPVGMEVPRPHLRPVEHEVDAALPQPAVERTRQVVARAPSVHQHAHDDAALRGAHQRVGDQAAGRVVGEDVRLEPNFLARRLDRRDQRRKVLAPAAQQAHAVAGQEAGRGCAHAR